MARTTSAHLANVVRRWKKALASAKHAWVFSPYIRSSTAETVLLVGRPSSWEIHTVFCAESFLNGGSSVATLRRLLRAGCKLFHVDGLHAKVLIVPDTWATVGSQNLTVGGTRNREATISTSNPRLLAEIASGLRPWMLSRTPITAEMLDDMESRLPAVKRQYRVLHNSIAAIDDEVHHLEANRRRRQEAEALEAERRRRMEAEAAARRKRLAREVAELPSSDWQWGSVKVVPTGSYGSSSTKSLMASGANFTHWWLDGEEVLLGDLHRYLTILQDTGQVGWARVGKTRITFVGREIWGTRWLAGHYCRIDCEAKWPLPRNANSNLVIRVSHPWYSGSVRLAAWLSPKGLEISSVALQGDGDRTGLHSIRVDLEASMPKTTSVLLDLCLAPWRPTEGSLFGAQATEFFGEEGTTYRMHLTKSGAWKILIGRRA